MDWLKVEKTTPNKPEIRVIARECKCTRAEAFLAWFKLWCTLDDLVGQDSFLPDYTLADADQDSGLQGMGSALETAGWLVFSPSGCSITNWTRHNGKSAKQRALTARRVRAYEARSNGKALHAALRG